MERIPRLVDTLDSALFALLTVAFGRAGRTTMAVVLIVLLGAAASADATVRQLLLVAISSYWIGALLRMLIAQARALLNRVWWQGARQS